MDIVVGCRNWGAQTCWSLTGQGDRRLLGSGNYAQVYQGLCNRTGEAVAVKILSKSHEGNRVDVLRGEIHALQYISSLTPQASSCGFIKLLDTLEDSENVYLVLELCTGLLLSDLQLHHHSLMGRASLPPNTAKAYKQQPLPEAHVAWVVKQLARSLMGLHGMGIIHRDIKPENVMFSSKALESGLKLIDFGMAYVPTTKSCARGSSQNAETRDASSAAKESKGIEEATHPATCHTFLHNQQRSSPRFQRHRRWATKEARRGSSNIRADNQCDDKDDATEGGQDECTCSEIMGTECFVAPEVLREQKYTPAVDIWSLGVTTYLLLSGCHPYANDDKPSWKEVSAEGRDAVHRMLQQDPTRRPTASQIVCHPWLQIALSPLMGLSQQHMVEYQSDTDGDKLQAQTDLSICEAQRFSAEEGVVPSNTQQCVSTPAAPVTSKDSPCTSYSELDGLQPQQPFLEPSFKNAEGGISSCDNQQTLSREAVSSQDDVKVEQGILLHDEESDSDPPVITCGNRNALESVMLRSSVLSHSSLTAGPRALETLTGPSASQTHLCSWDSQQGGKEMSSQFLGVMPIASSVASEATGDHMTVSPFHSSNANDNRPVSLITPHDSRPVSLITPPLSASSLDNSINTDWAFCTKPSEALPIVHVLRPLQSSTGVWRPTVASSAPHTVPQMRDGGRHALMFLPALPDSWR
ncbi:hypothetical protein CEUSTIGMA_g4856.t1 [Chlamydomonas eustigma]|uniref:Protein kinase domain-containing protein n=1 Tax=Chlamydomonas eustigma TaxID=1157962 RepID=A0A250X3R4_9CHLO|nr:hypothetical protein CEUSTIGMA_g4856.t1 [Chlamydomonas eustigma]|eukprot:GAX77410.1 hypothetical protein CEUSTIGMA_g4856.t1 [Chlamydomonas eustigma]